MFGDWLGNKAELSKPAGCVVSSVNSSIKSESRNVYVQSRYASS